MQNVRQKRVASDIEKIVSVFLNENVAPLYEAVIVSVVRSEISHDLKNINLYVSIYDMSGKGEEDKIFLTVLNKATQARNEVAKKCNIKYIPLLNFVHDTGYSAEDRINKKIEEINKANK